jgi:carbon-monoxide dehydrogenase catalytic subunit
MKYPAKREVCEKTPYESTKEMLTHMEKLGIENVFDRFDAQKPLCKYGLDGICCKICNMGPCRTTKKSPKGICGADADVIVARNLLRNVAAGVSVHVAHGKEILLALKAAGERKLNIPIRGNEEIIRRSKIFGFYDKNKSINELAVEIANFLLEDFSRILPGSNKTLISLAPKERLDVWEELDILPIGAYDEIVEALHRSTLGTDGDWKNLIKQVLRCGLTFAWNGVVGSTIATDCLYGKHKRTTVKTNLGAINPKCVNIAIHGHSPLIAEAIIRKSNDNTLINKAKLLGAQGISIYGICCTGNITLSKFGDVNPIGNAIAAELILATGVIDLWVADFQDIFPSIMDVATCFHTKVITTSDSSHLPGAEHIGFDHKYENMEKIDKIAEIIVTKAIDAFKSRDRDKIFIPHDYIEAEVGFSDANLIEAFGGVNNIYKHIKNGDILGIANLVGCNNPKVIYEKAIIDIANILLKENILILTNGCAAYSLMKGGLCNVNFGSFSDCKLLNILKRYNIPPVIHMGECLNNAYASSFFRAIAEEAKQPLKNMPFAFVSPEWSNEKAIGAALSFRLMGINSYHCINLPIEGSRNVEQFFTQDTQELLGAVNVVDSDFVSLANRIVYDLKNRRLS